MGAPSESKRKAVAVPQATPKGEDFHTIATAMALPNKSNAEYFTHDSDMRNDVKIKALRRRFEHKGYAVWCFILEALTDSPEFELPFGDIDRELLAADFDLSVQELNEIVNYCVRLGLLTRSDRDRDRIFSANHKRRFADMLVKREKLSEAGRRGMARRWSKDTSESNNLVITPDNEVITPDNIVEYSRVEKSRVEESKIEYPLQDIAELWNSICSSLPKVIKLNDTRRKKLKARIKEWGGEKDCLDKAREIFARTQASDFLSGSNQQNWTATFDWIIENPSNWIKVQEGNYDNRRGTPRGAFSACLPGEKRLGVGEYISPEGTRTYGAGKAVIPDDAPPRPSERHSWNASGQNWILI